MSAAVILLAIEIALIAAVLVSTRRRGLPVAALSLVILTAPLEVYRSSVGGFNLSLFRISLACAAVVSLQEILRRRRRGPVDWLLLGAIASLAVAVGASLALHPVNSFLGQRQVLTLAVGAAAVAVVARLLAEVPYELVGRMVTWSTVLPILAAAWQALAPRFHQDPTLPLVRRLVTAEGLEVNVNAPVTIGMLSQRTKGTFGDPNHFGVYLVLGLLVSLALCLAALRRRERPEIVSAAATVVAIALTLLSTYSRTAWIGATVGFIVLLVLLRSSFAGVRPRGRGRWALGIGMLAAVGVAIPIAPNVVERLNPSAPVNVGSNRVHESTLRAAVDEFTSSPVFGGGPGSLGAHLNQGKRTSAAHSTYLTAAGELGIIGLLLILCVGTLTLRRLLVLRRRLDGTARLVAAALAAAYAGFLVSNITYDLFYDDFHWILIAMAASAVALPSLAATSRRTRD